MYICFWNTFHLKVRKGTKKNALVQIFKTQMHYFFYFVTKTDDFATSSLVFMALNLICYVLHKPLLFPLFTHSSCFSLVPFELCSLLISCFTSLAIFSHSLAWSLLNSSKCSRPSLVTKYACSGLLGVSMYSMRTYPFSIAGFK